MLNAECHIRLHVYYLHLHHLVFVVFQLKCDIMKMMTMQLGIVLVVDQLGKIWSIPQW